MTGESKWSSSFWSLKRAFCSISQRVSSQSIQGSGQGWQVSQSAIFCVKSHLLSLHRAIVSCYLSLFDSKSFVSVQGWLHLTLKLPWECSLGISSSNILVIWSYLFLKCMVAFVHGCWYQLQHLKGTVLRLRAGAMIRFMAGNKRDQPAFTLSHRAF